MTTFGDVLHAALPGVPVQANAPLAPLTTFKVGGPADWLVEPASGDDLVRVVQFVQQQGLPLTMLGGGSNVLIADAGIRGVVVRPRGGTMQLVGRDIVRADAAVTINGLVRWTVGRGLAGLEAWAGTPGTVGGAIYGNAHWRQANIGDVVESVRVLTRDGGVRQIPADRLDFDYDTSRLQQSGEILVWAAFRVRPGQDPDALRAVARASLAFRQKGFHETSLDDVAECPLPGAFPDGRCDILLRADDIVHDDDAPVKAQIVRKAFRGAEYLYTLRLAGGETVLALVPSHHDHALGQWIGIRPAVDHVVPFERALPE